MTESPLATVERLLRATNAHDVAAIVDCFADDYALEAPLHPARSFRGKAQVQSNWTQIFAAVPDARAKLVGAAETSDAAWTEWEMWGTRRDGQPHLMRGVFIFGVAGGRIHWGRMFLEPVEQGGQDQELALRQQLSGAGR